MNRTDRLYALVDELRGAAPRARSARWLAERFEVSTRTVERDLLALQQAGIPIWATPGVGGGYRLDPAATLPPLNFTPAEVTAIAVALSTSRPLPFGAAARSALRKIVSASALSSRENARELAARIHLIQPPVSQEPPWAATLRIVEAALAGGQVVELDYLDRSGVLTGGRLVEPAGLVGSAQHWYLVGWCRLRQAGRAFRLDRIQAARVTDEPAPPHRVSEISSGLVAWIRDLSLEA